MSLGEVWDSGRPRRGWGSSIARHGDARRCCHSHEDMRHQIDSTGPIRKLMVTDYGYAYLARIAGMGSGSGNRPPGRTTASARPSFAPPDLQDQRVAKALHALQIGAQAIFGH